MSSGGQRPWPPWEGMAGTPSSPRSPGPWSAPEPPAAPPTGWWLLSLRPGLALPPPGPPALLPTHVHLSGPPVLWDMEGLMGRGMLGCRGPHPLPQVFSLCTLHLQLLPPLSGSRVGFSKGPRQPLVAVLKREELGLPLDLPYGAAGKTLGWGCAWSGQTVCLVKASWARSRAKATPSQ